MSNSKIVHQLKTWPEYFSEVVKGNKTFELRKNDRGFQIGEILDLHEYSIASGYSGQKIQKEISYILSLGDYLNVHTDYVILGFVELNKKESHEPK